MKNLVYFYSLTVFLTFSCAKEQSIPTVLTNTSSLKSSDSGELFYHKKPNNRIYIKGEFLKNKKYDNFFEDSLRNYIQFISKDEFKKNETFREKIEGKCFEEDRNTVFQANINSCCCVDILYLGEGLPGIPPGLITVNRNYWIFEATNYYLKIDAFKDGNLIWQSNPFLPEPLCPDPKCGYHYSQTVLGSVFNECPGLVKIVLTRFYRVNNIDYICDTDTFSTYWNGNPVVCDDK